MLNVDGGEESKQTFLGQPKKLTTFCIYPNLMYILNLESSSLFLNLEKLTSLPGSASNASNLCWMPGEGD